eukprot:tig00000624_g2643.t1
MAHAQQPRPRPAPAPAGEASTSSSDPVRPSLVPGLNVADLRPTTASAANPSGRRPSLGMTSYGGPILSYARRPPSAGPAAPSARTRAIQSLPPEIWARVLSHVPQATLVRLSAVSREWQRICWRPELWERFELEVQGRVPFRTVLSYLRRIAGIPPPLSSAPSSSAAATPRTGPASARASAAAAPPPPPPPRPPPTGRREDVPREVDLRCAKGPVGLRQDTGRDLIALLGPAERLVLPRFLVHPCLVEAAFAALPRLRLLRISAAGGTDELWLRGGARAHFPAALAGFESELVLFLEGQPLRALPPGLRSLRASFRTGDAGPEGAVEAAGACLAALETLDLTLLGDAFNGEPLRFSDWDLKCLLRDLPQLRVLRLPHTRCSEGMLQALAARLEELEVGTPDVKAPVLKNAPRLRVLRLSAPLRSFGAQHCGALQRVELDASRAGEVPADLWNCPELSLLRFLRGAPGPVSAVGCPKFPGRPEGPNVHGHPARAPAPDPAASASARARRPSLPGPAR